MTTTQRRGTVPTHLTTLHTLSCPAPFLRSEGGQVLHRWTPAPAHSVTILKLGMLDNPNSTWLSMLPPQVSSTWQFQTPHCSRDLQHHKHCNVTRATQEIRTQGSLFNSPVLGEETEAAGASWLPRARQELAVLSSWLLPGWPCVVCLEHRELHKHRQHSWAFEGISGGCGAFPHQHPSCSAQLNLKKQLSPQAKFYPRRSSIISLRITDLRQDLLSEVEEKSYWGRRQETAPSIISAP